MKNSPAVTARLAELGVASTEELFNQGGGNVLAQINRMIALELHHIDSAYRTLAGELVSLQRSVTSTTSSLETGAAVDTSWLTHYARKADEANGQVAEYQARIDRLIHLRKAAMGI